MAAAAATACLRSAGLPQARGEARDPWRGLRRRKGVWGRPRDGDTAKGGQRSPLAHWWQINLVVLEERYAVVCKNRTTIQLLAEFHVLAAFCGTGKGYDRDIQGM